MYAPTRLVLPLLLVTISLLAASGNAGAASSGSTQPALVKVARVGSLGRILVTGKGFALYRWTREKTGTIRCTGQCAKVWPPLLLAKGTTAPKMVSGAAGRFGVITRPDRSRQLTHNGLALYTYTGDTKPGEALCQGADGWYVLSASSR
ncbi:MAG TPA: hypothetical protein VF221_10225 [Chloroflexota bacterium]